MMMTSHWQRNTQPIGQPVRLQTFKACDKETLDLSLKTKFECDDLIGDDDKMIQAISSGLNRSVPAFSAQVIRCYAAAKYIFNNFETVCVSVLFLLVSFYLFASYSFFFFVVECSIN